MSRECCCSGDDPPGDQLWYPVTICSEVGLPPADCDEYIFANQEVCNWCTSEEKYHFFKPCEESGYLAGCCIKIPDGAIAYIEEINLPDNNCKLESTEDLEQLAIDDCWACCSTDQIWNCQAADTCGICVDGLGGACQGGDTIKCGEGESCGDYSITITTPSVQVYADYEYITANDSGCCVQTFPSFSVTAPLTQSASIPCYWSTGNLTPDSPTGEIGYILPQHYSSNHRCSDPDHGCYCAGFPSTWDDCPQCGGLACPCCKVMQLDELTIEAYVQESTPISGYNCSPTPCSIWSVSVQVQAAGGSCSPAYCMEQCGFEDCYECQFINPIHPNSGAIWKVVKPWCGCPSGDFSGSLSAYPYVGGVTGDFCSALISMPQDNIKRGFASTPGATNFFKYDHATWLDGITVTIS